MKFQVWHGWGKGIDPTKFYVNICLGDAVIHTTPRGYATRFTAERAARLLQEKAAHATIVDDPIW